MQPALVAALLAGCTLSHTPLQGKKGRYGDPDDQIEVSTNGQNAAQNTAQNTAAPPEPPQKQKKKGAESWNAAVKQASARLEKNKSKKRAEMIRLDGLAKDLRAEPFLIDNPCIDDNCTRTALERVFKKLDKLDQTDEGLVRILHLGDSHIAADYITGTVRKWLQHRYGFAGRGFVAVDQRAAYGGRRLNREGWKRTRIVDKGRSKNPFGFSGMSLESKRDGAKVDFEIKDDDAEVTIYYHTQRGGARLRILANDTVLGEIDTRSTEEQSLGKTFRLPALSTDGKENKLDIVADGPGAKVFGISFESKKPGLLYDAIGPVGADARVYLSLNQKSFKEHLNVLKPDLVVIMVGGNDALLMRQGKRSLDDVRTDHERIIEAIQKAYPGTDCMLWSPMDAGEIIDGRIVSKRFISEVRNMQRAAATNRGCAFWDMFESMGSEGSFARWHRAGIMNDDLIHPRAAAGELLGHLFSTAFMEAYVQAR